MYKLTITIYSAIFAKRKDAYAPYVAIMPLVLDTSHRTQGLSPDTISDQRGHSTANQAMIAPFQSVGDIIGFAKVVRAQRNEALEQLNHVLTQPWVLRSKNTCHGGEEHRRSLDRMQAHPNPRVDSLPPTQRCDGEMEV